MKTKAKFNASRLKEGGMKLIFGFSAAFSAVAVFGIIGYIFYGSLPAFRAVGFFKFLFGTEWLPSFGRYGILPMIVNTLLITFGAVCIGGTVGVFAAVFLVFWCPEKLHIPYRGTCKFLRKCVHGIEKINLRAIFDQAIKVLAGIPSIVYGIFGLGVIVPMLAAFSRDGVGQGVLACSILLALMILPTLTSLTANALASVPEAYLEGALALGNTKAQAVFRAVFPAARSGVVSALILGVGRAVGEAMAVIWVSGNRALFPTGLFSYIRPLTANIVMEMGYAEISVHRPALIATGLVLLVLVLLITLSLNLVPKGKRGRRGTMKLHPSGNTPVFVKKGKGAAALKVVSMISAGAVGAALLILIGYITVLGAGSIGASGLFSKASKVQPTLLPALLATLELIALTLLIALPLGVGAAVFLVEYTKPNSKIVKPIRTFIDTLAGVPSILFGLFGMILFVERMGLGKSVLAGALTMALVVLPTVIRAAEESLRAVPMSLREASYGLGAGKTRTIFKVVLPAAFSGVATAGVLAVGRIVGESAAIVFTMGTLYTFSGSPLSGAASLSVLLYSSANEGLYMKEAYGLALILVLITVALNFIVYLIERRVKKRSYDAYRLQRV